MYVLSMKTNYANIEANRLTVGGVITRIIDTLSAEIVQLEKRYWTAASEVEAKQIARKQNQLENKLNRIRQEQAEGRALGVC